MTAREPSKRCRNRKDDVKTRLQALAREKSEGNLITAQTASGTEMAPLAQRLLQGTWEPVAGMPRENFKQRPCKKESTDARHRDGLTGSSEEASVMGVERSGQLIQLIELIN